MNEITNVEVAGTEMMEPVRISPENLVIAETYLQCGDIGICASELEISRDVVADALNKREVQKFIDTVYMDVGYRNRNKLGTAMDRLIDDKLEEMSDAEITSSKDISELLQMAHKMRIDEMKLQLEMLKLEHKARDVVKPSVAVNIQDNSEMGGNYGQLMAKLLK